MPGGDLVLTPDHLVSASTYTAYDLRHDRWQFLAPPTDNGLLTITGPSWWFDGSLFAYATRNGGSAVPRLGRFTPSQPRGTFALSGPQRPPPDCQGGGSGTWRLSGHPEDRMLVRLQQGRKRVSSTWSDGWTVTFRPLRILDTTGKVVARGGDRYGMCGSSG